MKQRRLITVLAFLVLTEFLICLYLSVANFKQWKIWFVVYLTPSNNKDSSLTGKTEELAIEEEQRRRQYLITKHCQSDPPGSASSIIVERRSSVSYCLSRKISSTFWLQVLTYLDQKNRHEDLDPGQQDLNRDFNPNEHYNDLDLGHRSPMDLRKLDVQLRPQLKYYSLENGPDRRLIFNTTRFMFVRDPYSRLWSVFMDKFIIPDWWFLNKFGTVILNNKGFKISNAGDYCSQKYKISFQDFLDFVVNWNNRTSGQMDDHFGTVINHCNPCMYKPQFVGKLETFEQDSKHVLKLLHFEEYATVLKYTERALEEMLLLIDYNYYMFSQRFQTCLSWCVAKLLDVFKMNGYLSTDAIIRLKRKLPLSKSALIKEVNDEFRQSNRTKRQMSIIKRKWRQKAYKRVSRKTLLQIVKVYEREAMMFGYSTFPDFLIK